MSLRFAFTKTCSGATARGTVKFAGAGWLTAHAGSHTLGVAHTWVIHEIISLTNMPLSYYCKLGGSEARANE